ncbi:MAG: MotA/TolQ/ExbB proton channel family protein [Oscillatoriales cyanobacterium C42_A2020_001]|nr:MotA/TolQ/ExbB proton channel family protein [Leptolyngbyaceae cyanobacterium C42_A2020_001]
MTRLFDLLAKGGPVMIPIVGLSVVTLACALERAVFWVRLLRREDRIVHDVLEAARYDLREAEAIAQEAQDLPIGRFLLAPLKLNNPTPETFHLAMEAVADQEFSIMRKGDLLLETTINMAPLLGLLGTVTGLIVTFLNLNIGVTGQKVDLSKAALGIAEALITTAGGMIVAILALAIFRISISLQARQMDYFSKVGSELELIYRQIWYEPSAYTVSYTGQPELPLSGREG